MPRMGMPGILALLKKDLDTIFMSGSTALYYIVLKYGLGFPVSTVEFIGILLLITSYSMMRKENVWGLVLVCVSNVFMAAYYFGINLPAQSVLRMIYIGINTAGIYMWLKPSKDTKQKLRPTTTAPWILTAAAFGFFALVAAWLERGGVAVMDVAIFYLSMFGKLVMLKKKIEGWYAWLFSDALGIILFAMTGAYMSLFRSFITFGNSIAAIMRWRKEIITNK
jgi:nicotinamide mononucleotide transporter